MASSRARRGHSWAAAAALVVCLFGIPDPALGLDPDSSLWIQGDAAGIALGDQTGVTIERDADGNLLFGDQHTPTKVKLSDIAAVIAWAQVSGGQASSCKELYDYGVRISKTYSLLVQGQQQEFYCDMARDGGGWTLVGSIEGSHLTKNLYPSFSSWESTFAVSCAGGDCAVPTNAPLSSGFLKSAWTGFSDIREEIYSGSKIIYSLNVTSSQMDCVQTLYGTTRAEACVPPPCRLSTPDGIEVSSCQYSCANPEGCAMGTGGSPSVLGYQLDAFRAVDTANTNCWWARGNCCSALGGTGRCSSGDADGTAFGKLWLR